MNAQYQIAEQERPRVQFVTDSPFDILRHARDSFAAGIPVALVTLVDIRGGAARPLGAQMSVRIDGLYCGFVSGGCTEAAVAAEAVEALKVGHDRFLLLGEGSPFFDIVLPCGGGIRLSIHILKDIKPIDRVLDLLAARQVAALLYRPEAETLVEASAEKTEWLPVGFMRSYRPPTKIVVSGNRLEADAVALVARAAGYEVQLAGKSFGQTVADLPLDMFTAVALLDHDLDAELPALEAALRSPAFYIGALGSRRTHDRRRRSLLNLGFTDAEISRIKAPIGIFDKARDASSLALSVVADIAAVASAETYENCAGQG
ncbi:MULTISPECIES: XdhC family protein [unclassified Rhizobium]|uniref:XdhC family protein n=1 Tax=unclassified Rhizobium TaxID=2613769 RepID=UPI001ADC6E02|nr:MULTISPECIES: XdhC family protein [unclassified Rhizobium]MBO9127758.1 XdhC family protein [Rhizobium sp. 16-488-2b]MBO9178220.1 XdhC family protein [Rhizobium sp. 16-488-2a]